MLSNGGSESTSSDGGLHMRNILSALVLAAVALPGSAFAQTLAITISQIGNDVVISGNGSFVTTGLSFFPSGTLIPGLLDPSVPAITFAEGAVNTSSVFTTTVAFGTGGEVAGTTTGDVFGFYGDSIYLASGYVSGTPLSGTVTFANATFDSLGINPGYYILSGPSVNTITITALEAPEPASWALMISGFGVVGSAMRRRRKVAALRS